MVGGLIIELVGGPDAWRWVFLVNIPVGIVALVLALRLLPQLDPGSPDTRLDPVGVVLLGAAVLLVLLPLLGESDSDLAGRPWWLLAVAAVVLAGFVLWERRLARRGGAPVMDLGLFARRSYALGAGLALWYFAGFTSIFFVLTLTLQSGLGYTALQAGLAATPFALGGGMAAIGGGRLVARLGRRIVVVGLCSASSASLPPESWPGWCPATRWAGPSRSRSSSQAPAAVWSSRPTRR